jgi:hypothetical protein
VSGRSQEALYSGIDLELSWSEDELPQVMRTKHVHGLHPYLGKFIPQLVEVFLQRYFTPGDCVYDPFVGSGTTLVEANMYGAASIGCDISAFNCLLSRVKTASYSLGALEVGLKRTLEEARRPAPTTAEEPSQWLQAPGTRNVRCGSFWPTDRRSGSSIRRPRRWRESCSAGRPARLA